MPQGDRFLGYVIIPPGVEKSLSQLRCSVGKAIDRRSRHVPRSGALFIESCLKVRGKWKGPCVCCARAVRNDKTKTCECEKHTKRWDGGWVWSDNIPLSPRHPPKGVLTLWGGRVNFPPSQGSAKCDSNLVDSASSHTLVSKIKPCMSKYKRIYTVKLRTAH